LFSDSTNTVSNSLDSSPQSKFKRAKITQLSPIFELPIKGRLPLFYFEKNLSCTIDSTVSDSSGEVWLFLVHENKKGWALSDNVQMSSSDDKDSALFNDAISVTDVEIKRRLHIVLEHKEWPRRIQKIVKDGKICLEMTKEQLLASWGEPIQKNDAFLLGFGKHEVWFYKGTDGRYLVVNVAQGKVIGWSL
jgi:hypothetical protein